MPPINMRKFEPQPNTITSAMLQDAAVINSKIAASAVDSAQLAANSVSSAKIAALAVDSTKIADNAIDLSQAKVTGALPASKASPGLKTKLLIGDDTEMSRLGNTELEVKNVRFAIDAAISTIASVVMALELKTSAAASAVEAKIYIDAETTARMTLSSSAVAYAVSTGSFSVSDLTAGAHTLRIKLRSVGVSDTAFLQLTEAHLVSG